ncbi:tetratricopeptide repeat protein [Candidatus Sumerlaeota bacterium]|nr:tetratricopeptide repeat protein [Candidatus Sumerlaeota bacterium]
MSETLNDRISHLFQEFRYCEIRKIFMDSRTGLFSGDTAPSSNLKNLLLLFSRSLKELGYRRMSHKLLSHILKKDSDVDYLLEYAQSCLEYQNVIKALKTLDQVRESGTTREDHIFMMHALYSWMYALMDAFESAESSLARASEYATPLNEEFFTVTQSRIFFIRGDWEKAQSPLVSLLAGKPAFFSALLRLAFIQAQSGQWDLAIKNYTHALQIRPESFSPIYELGYLFLKTAHYEEAYEALLNANNLSPDNDYSRSLCWGIGFSLFQQKQCEKALSWFRKAQSKDMVKACLNLQLGKTEEQIEIRLPFPEMDTAHFPEKPPVEYLLNYWKRDFKPPRETDDISLISNFRAILERNQLKTRSFIATPERIIRLLRMELPVVVLLSDFDGRHYHIVTGYNSLTDCFAMDIAGEMEYSRDDLFEKMRSTDYWAMAAFPEHKADIVSSVCPVEDDECFRALEKAEEDLSYLRLAISKRRIESVPPGHGYMMRLRLLHSLRKLNRPAASLEPTIKIILKASNYSEPELGFAAREYFMMKRYSDCMDTAKKSLCAKSPGAAFLCAQSALEMDLIPQALRYNALGLSRFPDDVDLIIQRGAAFRRNYDYRECFRFFRIVQESCPDYPPLLREVGETYRLMRQYDKAEEYLNRSIELTPDDSLSWQSILAVYEEQYRYQTAEKTCQNVLQQNPDKEWAYIFVSNFYLRQSMFPEALSILDEGLRNHPDSIQLNLIRLEILERSGETGKAEKGYRLLLDKRHNNKLIQVHYAIFLTNKDSYEEAYPIFENVTMTDPDFQPAIIGMARWYALQNNLQLALDLVKRSLTMNKSDSELVTFLYRLCIPLDAIKEGAHFLLALSRDSSSYLNAGYLFEITDDFDQASRLYRKAHTLQKNNPQPLFRIAQIHHKKGDIEEAEKIYKEVLEIDPRHDFVLEGLALISLEKTDISNAMGYLERLLTVYPDYERAQELYVEIAEARQRFERCRAFLEALSPQSEYPAHFSLLLGKIAEAENNFDLAFHYYNQSLQFDDAYIPSHLQMALFEMKRKNYEASKSILDKCVALQPYLPEIFVLRAQLWEKMGKRSLAIKDCCKAMELGKTDDEMELEPYDLLAELTSAEEINRDSLEKHYRVILPGQFYSLLGGAYERKGDMNGAKRLYELAEPFNPNQGDFEAIIGLTYIARYENDHAALSTIREYTQSLLDESETHPEMFSPIEQANLREAIAFILEGERSLSELKESLNHWRYALKLTRSLWALEHAAYACLDLGELTKDGSYFREAIVYLRELRNPVDVQSIFSPALGDAFYFLNRYQDAVREYNTFFNMEERDPSLQPVFFRYLDAMERIHSPVSDITELAVQKLESLPTDRISASYRNALQERIFHNYVRTHQHRAALRTAIRAKGLFQGLFRYFKSIFRMESSP